MKVSHHRVDALVFPLNIDSEPSWNPTASNDRYGWNDKHDTWANFEFFMSERRSPKLVLNCKALAVANANTWPSGCTSAARTLWEVCEEDSSALTPVSLSHRLNWPILLIDNKWEVVSRFSVIIGEWRFDGELGGMTRVAPSFARVSKQRTVPSTIPAAQ